MSIFQCLVQHGHKMSVFLVTRDGARLGVRISVSHDVVYWVHSVFLRGLACVDMFWVGQTRTVGVVIVFFVIFK